VDALGNVTTYQFDPGLSKPTQVTDPLGNLLTLEYDPQGNLTVITEPIEHLKPPADRLKTTFSYDARGRVLSRRDQLGAVTQFEYDAAGDLTAVQDPLGNRTEYTYDSVSRLLSQRDAAGRTTRFAYDALDRRVQVMDALGQLTQATYDANGNLTSMTDPLGRVTTQEFDPMDRLIRRTDPLGGVETFTYDRRGNLTTYTDAKGQTTTHTYDAQGRRIKTTFADGTYVEAVFDSADRLLAVRDSEAGTLEYAYDAVDRLLQERSDRGVVSYAYDAVGRRTQMTVNGQPPVSYTYDASSRVAAISQPPLGAVQLEYDARHQRSRLTLPNGVRTSYSYDAARRLTGLTYEGPGGLLGDLTYTHDATGRRVSTGGSLARSLLPEPVAGATYDAANQQLRFGNRSSTFDANGNLLSLTQGTNSQTFTYDARDRLRAITGSGLTATFSYDALGRRRGKTINGVTTTYLYDGLEVVQETATGRATHYLRGVAIDEVFLRGEAELLLADVRGDTLAITDASGTMVTEYSYEPFGRTEVAGLASTNPVQYTGREADETGLYFYRTRYYAPFLGRFTQRDLLGLLGGVNAYVYVENDPMNGRDPLGLYTAPLPNGIRPTECGGGWFGARRGGGRTHKGLDLSGAVGQTIVAPMSGRLQRGSRQSSSESTLTVCRPVGKICCKGKLVTQEECFVLSHVVPNRDPETNRPSLPRQVTEGEAIATVARPERCYPGGPPYPPHVHVEWWLKNCPDQEPTKKNPEGAFPLGPP
jgi:RHS repeat-associated protein